MGLRAEVAGNEAGLRVAVEGRRVAVEGLRVGLRAEVAATEAGLRVAVEGLRVGLCHQLPLLKIMSG